MKITPDPRRRHHVARASVFFIALALIAATIGGTCGGPTIPPSEDLEIRDWYDLDAVRDNPGGDHILMNDLNSATAGYEELAGPTANQGKGWRPIGALDPVWGVWGPTTFRGTFDGQGYEIRDLFINRPGEDCVGLFGLTYANRFVRDVGVVNVTVTGDRYVGGLVGWYCSSEGMGVSNSYSTGTVTGRTDVGGLIGWNEGGDVTDSYSTGTVFGGSQTGGLVGRNYFSTVSNCYYTGSVTGGSEVGGLVGQNEHDCDVTNSYSNATVVGGSRVGGLVGLNCDDTDRQFGGGTISSSYSTSTVSGSKYVGGLVGDNDAGTVSNSYSTGNVTGERCVGGLVGDYPYGLFGNFPYGTVTNSYYNYDKVFINGENIITVGALFCEDFDQWLANDKFLDVNERLFQEDGYYVVNNVSDFKELLAFGWDNSLRFRLKNDLDLAAEPNFYIPYFSGEFDGNGHKVLNLSFDFHFINSVGLFGYVTPDGKVAQVGVENVNITGSYSVGGLVGWNEGTVSSSNSSGSVTGDYLVGGLVALNEGTIIDSYSAGSVTGDHVGGLVGDNWGIVSNSYATGSAVGNLYVGGLVAINQEEATVSNSYATGSVTGTRRIGGLIGMNQGTISNSYSTGDVIGDEIVGGLVGLNEDNISNSYSTGTVTGDVSVGGLVGENDGTVSDSFWDTETSGQSASDGGTGKTTAEMQDIATFSGAGWDIIAVADPGTRNPSYTWNIVNGVAYPFLSWQA
jgi:hypothetical protein